MRDLREFAEGVLAHGDVGVILVGQDLSVEWRSPAAQRLFGTGPGALPDMVDLDSSAPVASFLDRVGQAGGQAVRMVCSVPVEGSSARRVELTGRDLRGVPAVGGLVVTAHDVTGWAEREEAVRTKLLTDPLTGLGNRTSITERLWQAVHSAAPAGPRPAVILVDLDSFKSINDSYGHAIGDDILRTVAERILATVGSDGSAARFGGDEFVILLDRTTELEAIETAERIQAALRLPVPMVGVPEAALTASFGATMVDPGRRPESILAQADAAMYRAKDAGRDRVVLFGPDLKDWSLTRKRDVESLAQTVQQLREENEALQEAASVDFRTGLSNAATFDADHAQLHARHARSREPYSVVLVDIDNFHNFNSRYRYLAGNDALRRVADTITATLRRGDRAYRWGGEEFTVLLPGTDLAGAEPVAERLRAAVQGLGIEHRDSRWGVVTVTVAVVEAGSCHPGAESVFEAANVALLEGKDAGRNRVVGRSCSDL